MLGFASGLSAHTTGETYVWLNVEENNITGRVEINLNDLRKKMGLAVPEDNEEAKQFIAANEQIVLDYIKQHYSLEADGKRVELEFTGTDLLPLPADEGIYAQYSYTTPAGTTPDIVTIQNSLFVEDSFTHRSLVCIQRNRKSGQTFDSEFTAMVFGAHNPVQDLDLTHIELLPRPRDFVWQGVLHIWIGIDHILFIIALLLPAVLVSTKRTNKAIAKSDDAANNSDTDGDTAAKNGWRPVAGFREAFWAIIRIVTIFTIAHSITLSLASLGLVQLPSRLIESVIALSIVFVAWNTITQKFHDRTWVVIFLFGLFHGMGFASVMSELPFRMIHLVKVLIGFNVGVELGQLAIVAAVFPLLFLLRKTSAYVPVILKGGSAIIGLIAVYWFIERAFALGA